jgi:hypothetical protein
MRLGLDRLWLFLAVALPALVSLIVALPAVDLAYAIRAGAAILASRAIPGADTYTFTVAGLPWVDQQWLAQVALALLHRLGGWELLAVTRAAMVASAFGLVAAAATARGAAPRTAAILALLAFGLAAPALALRAQLAGVLLFAVLLWLVAGRERHPARLWLAPFVVLLWANVHGSVVLAPVLLGAAWLEDLAAGRPGRRSLVVLALGLVATLANPFGVGVWAYAAGIGSNSGVTAQVSEWQRTSPFTVTGLLFYVSAAAVAMLVVRRRERLAWPAVGWLAVLFLVGAWTVRGLAWWPLGAAVTIAGWLPAGAPRRRPANRINAVVVAMLSLAVVAALPWWRPADPLTGRAGLLAYAPSGAAAALRSAAVPGDRVFAPQELGSWLEWAVPGAAYFVDSRIELFPAPVWAEYEVVAAGGSDAGPLLDRHGVRFVLADPSSPLARRLLDGGAWVVVHRDAESVLLRRGPP